METLTPQSLTTIQQARLNLLKPLLDSYNVWRESIGLIQMDHAEFVKKEYSCTLYEWLDKPLTNKERLKFYRLKGF